MAVKSLEAAGRLLTADPRSSASRYYYAAFQAMSALLIYSGLNPPEDREAWSHADTPKLVVANLSKLIPKRGQRNDLQNRLELLYKVRVSADYVSRDDVSAKLDVIRKHAEFLVKVAKGRINS